MSISAEVHNFCRIFSVLDLLDIHESHWISIVQLMWLNLHWCDFRAVQRSALCRSQRELSNAYLLAKFGFDTAENEPSVVCRIPWQQETTEYFSETPFPARNMPQKKEQQTTRMTKNVQILWTLKDAAKRIFTCNFWLRHSRERALNFTPLIFKQNLAN